MIRKLFLIDGAAGTGKSDLVEYIHDKHYHDAVVIMKFTTRKRRAYEVDRWTDLIFEEDNNFDLKFEDNEFYSYKYAGEKYWFRKNDLVNALNKKENVFILIRDRKLINKIKHDFSSFALVVSLYIYTDKGSIPGRLKKDGYNDEQIDFRLKRSEISWRDYLETPNSDLKIIINNSTKEDFHRKINLLFEEYSSMNIDIAGVLYINPSLRFDLIKPLVGFKKDIVNKLEKYPYDKNIFLMMKFRDSNNRLAKFIKDEVEKAGYNCVRADYDEWNITGNTYNPIAVLYCCKFGIALFDEPISGEEQNFSANVAYELGIMHYQKKECLILKHKSLSQLPFDLVKDIWKPYAEVIEIQDHLHGWIEKIKKA